jgi:hypothetical protein
MILYKNHPAGGGPSLILNSKLLNIKTTMSQSVLRVNTDTAQNSNMENAMSHKNLPIKNLKI